MLPYTARTFKSVPEDHVGSNPRYNEEKGDVCYARLMGTFIENDK